MSGVPIVGLSPSAAQKVARQAYSGLLLVATVALTACEDAAAPDASRAQEGLFRSLEMRSETISEGEREAGEKLAKSLATALRDNEARKELFLSLASSQVRESKVHFSSYASDRASRLKSALLSRGMNSRDLGSMIARIRDLELYMPFLGHRRIWTGDTNVIVGIALRDGDTPRAFKLDGTALDLSYSSPPATPVLMLVPSEGNYPERGQASPFVSGAECSPPAGISLLEAARRCSSISPTIAFTNASAASMMNNPMGINIRFIRISDPRANADRCWADCWYMGDPEYEIWVHELVNGNLDSYKCLGELNSSYDQNGNFWSGNFNILTPAEASDVQSRNPYWRIGIWEDDHQWCTMRMEPTEFNPWAAGFTGLSAIAWAVEGNFWGTLLWGSLFFNEMVMLDGGDDFIGNLTDIRAVSGASFPAGTTHAIIHNGFLYGRAILQHQTPAMPPPTTFYTYISGQAVAQPGATCHWSAASLNGSGSYSYEWYRDADLVATGPSYVGQAGQFTLQLVANDDVTGVVSVSDPWAISTSWGAPACDQFLRVPKP